MSFVKRLRSLLFRQHARPESLGRSGCRPKPVRCRLVVELLESRLVPSVLLVNTAADETTPNDGLLSLREAIGSASAGDQIAFDVRLSGQTISLTMGELFIDNDLTIVGLGADKLTVSGSHSSRVFEVALGSIVSISGLKIADGYDLDVGGGIRNQGRLTLQHCIVAGNAAFGGAGLFNDGTLTISGSTLSDNHAVTTGGGVWNSFTGTMTIGWSTFSANTAALGGGIDNDGTMTLRWSLVRNNTANNSGGIDDDGPATIAYTAITHNQATAGVGGGLWTFGEVSINASLVAYNTAALDGGGIMNGEVGVLLVTDSAILYNTAARDGGGIANADSASLTVRNTVLIGNVAGFNGGGIANDGAATATVTNTALTGNAAGNAGGGVSNTSVAPLGLTINHSLICGNCAPLGRDLFNDAYSTAKISADSIVCDIFNLGTIV